VFETKPRPWSQAVVEADAVTKRYGDDGGVEDLTLEVPRGRIFGLVGPSGSGKTTIVRLLLGAVAPDAGSLRVLGRDPLRAGARDRRRLGYLPQRSVLYPDLSVRHNLDFVASLSGLPPRSRLWPTSRSRRARARIDEVLATVGLEHRQRHRLRDLSGGERRRLALAAAMAHQPELLVLDEPTAGVDPVLRQDLWQHFSDLRDEGRSLVVTTQYVTEATECDLVGMLIDGRILHVATPDELRREAFGGHVLELVCSRPLSPGEIDELGDVPGMGPIRRAGSRERFRATVDDAAEATRRVGAWADAHDVAIETNAEVTPTFDDVFVELVERHRDAAGSGAGSR
jgi:ABC-2 type transport system ATP-binding protein